MNSYLVTKRFKQTAICGPVNIPAQTTCIEMNNVIIYNNKPICYATSENGHIYFVINTDGNGKQRYALIAEIKQLLELNNEPTKEQYELYNARWDAVFDSALCQPFKRPEHKDHWLWNHNFFTASIEDLQAIKNIIINAKGD